MGETGILDPTHRTELLDGEITQMSPIGSTHARAVAELHNFFHDALRSEAVVWSQGPLALSDLSEP